MIWKIIAGVLIFNVGFVAGAVWRSIHEGGEIVSFIHLSEVIKLLDKSMEKHCPKQNHCLNCEFEPDDNCILLLIKTYLKDRLEENDE